MRTGEDRCPHVGRKHLKINLEHETFYLQGVPVTEAAMFYVVAANKQTSFSSSKRGRHRNSEELDRRPDEGL